MTTSSEPGLAVPSPAGLDEGWRQRMLAVQEQALPAGRTLLSCPAPYGGGGLGRHMAEIAETLTRRRIEAVLIDESSAVGGAAPTAGSSARRSQLIGALAPLLRFSPQMRMWAASVRFDLGAAARLQSAEHLIAFNGTALAQFRAARAAGVGSLSLVSANSHFSRVVRQHELAHRRYPIERPWSRRLLGRNLSEYERAEQILVSSRYVWESFLEEGCAEERLSFFPLTPDVRYRHALDADADAAEGERGGTFDIVYVGSLVAHKGVPLLLDAFARLRQQDMRLILVGGWKTSSMRRYIESARAADPRIVVAPGDPLPHLRRAALCAHPAFEDGFGYAPAEALACGVPTVVSEDTGMKDLIAVGRNGLVLPTGDVGALAEAIEATYRGEILGG